jgi:biotin carboxyl carrier protein
MKYFVTVAGEEHEVVVDGQTVSIDGLPLTASLEELAGTPVKLLTIGHRVHRVLASRGSARSEYELAIDGFRFRVDALNERARVIRDLAGLSTAAAGPAPIVAPMPGMIVRVSVQAGDQVRAGQGLIVMEAMKMENELRATADGVVRSVLARPGTAVEKGALLLEIE